MIKANGVSDRIREHVLRTHVERARAQGLARFDVRAGDISRELHLINRIPQVISALRSRKFWEPNGLELVSLTAPSSAPSHQSTSVVLTFAIVSSAAAHPAGPGEGHSVFGLLRDLAGIAREVYSKLGGPEKALEDERSGFSR